MALLIRQLELWQIETPEPGAITNRDAFRHTSGGMKPSWHECGGIHETGTVSIDLERDIASDTQRLVATCVIK